MMVTWMIAFFVGMLVGVMCSGQLRDWASEVVYILDGWWRSLRRKNKPIIDIV